MIELEPRPRAILPGQRLARHCEDPAAPCSSVEPHELASLAEALATVPDPRRVRGRRCRIGALLVRPLRVSSE
jgi:hypothetical protein